MCSDFFKHDDNGNALNSLFLSTDKRTVYVAYLKMLEHVRNWFYELLLRSDKVN